MTRDELVARWVEAIRPIPWVTSAWLFGSMATNRDGPGSDIDLRVGVTQEPRDWPEECRTLMAPFGPSLIAAFSDGFVRLLVEPGYVIDLGKEIAPPGLVHVAGHRPIRILIEKVEVLPATEGKSEKWPETKFPKAAPPSPGQVETWTAEALVNMLAYPAMVRRGDEPSRNLYCALQRADLAKLIYELEGAEWAKGFKHMAEWSTNAHRLICADSLIWIEMLEILEQLAYSTGAEWPADAVADCKAMFCADLAEVHP